MTIHLLIYRHIKNTNVIRKWRKHKCLFSDEKYIFYIINCWSCFDWGGINTWTDKVLADITSKKGEAILNIISIFLVIAIYVATFQITVKDNFNKS